MWPVLGSARMDFVPGTLIVTITVLSGSAVHPFCNTRPAFIPGVRPETQPDLDSQPTALLRPTPQGLIPNHPTI